jgi:2-hydroxy-3-keto-5-methylthiopentenyl-1-phosphate phosphatase
MTPLIRAVLSKYIGEERSQAIEIIANDVDLGNSANDVNHGNSNLRSKWAIRYRHPTR